MDDKQMLLNRLQMCDFVLHETVLFLDTHPECQEALAYYKKHLALQRETYARYTAAYGPMRVQDCEGGTRWKWVDGPWPWENPCEVK